MMKTGCISIYSDDRSLVMIVVETVSFCATSDITIITRVTAMSKCLSVVPLRRILYNDKLARSAASSSLCVGITSDYSIQLLAFVCNNESKQDENH